MTSGPHRPTNDPALLRSVIGELMRSGSPSVARTAARLGIGRRTLQRRLAGGNLSHSAFVRAARVEIACLLLAETPMRVQEIGRLLGYAAPSGFARAFTGWTGLSPRAWRRAARLGRDCSKDGAASPSGAKW